MWESRIGSSIEVQRLGQEPSHEMVRQPREMTGTKSESLLDDLVQSMNDLTIKGARLENGHFDLDACGVIVSNIDYVIVKNIKTCKIETWSIGKMVRFT